MGEGIGKDIARRAFAARRVSRDDPHASPFQPPSITCIAALPQEAAKGFGGWDKDEIVNSVKIPLFSKKLVEMLLVDRQTCRQRRVQM